MVFLRYRGTIGIASAVVVIGAFVLFASFSNRQTHPSPSNLSRGPSSPILPTNIPEEIAKRLDSHKSARIIISGRTHGEPEPCPCTKPPSGGISRRSKAINSLRATGKSLYVIDSGDTLFDTESPILATLPKVAINHARVFAAWFHETRVDLYCPGEEDLVQGGSVFADIVPKRTKLVITNVGLPAGSAASFAQAELGGIQLGVVSLIDRGTFDNKGLRDQGLEFMDPTEALSVALRQMGRIELLLVILHAANAESARGLLPSSIMPTNAIIIDAGHIIPSSSIHQTSRLGGWLCVSPAQFGTNLTVIDLFVPVKSSPAVIDIAHAISLLNLQSQYKELAERLPTGSSGVNSADVVDRVVKLNVELGPRVTAALNDISTNTAILLQTPLIREGWEREPTIEAAINDARALEASALQEYSQKEIAYKGAAKCAECHLENHRNWLTTAHASAMNVLRKEGKDTSLSCIRCHVTGYGRIGGPIRLEGLATYEAVQCESCHVPNGQPHPGAEAAFEKVTSRTCLTCHTTRQDPYFKFESYLKHAVCTRSYVPGEERVPDRRVRDSSTSK